MTPWKKNVNFLADKAKQMVGNNFPGIVSEGVGNLGRLV